ncbi:MAG: LysR family transcriptional regulator, partial [Chloroflexi bacterium]|nr:LysR family transcriptional regulator [Chloroflexota bacterium]
MDLRHLNIFITVCDCGSMTRAAERLYMTQPSVSQAVAELERDYGVRLFERLNHRLYLTAAGDHLRSYARHILNLSEQARKELLDLSQGGSIRIGATLTIGAHLLPGLVASFRPRWPEADIYTQVDNTSVIEKLILEDRLDLGLVEGPVYSEHVVEQVLQDDDLVIICSPQHALAVSGRLHVSDLAGWGILIREQGSGTRDVFEHAMQAAGVPWKINGVYNNIEAIKQAVRADLGLGVVSRISVLEEVGRGQVVPLAVQGLSLKRKFNLIYHRQKYFTPV